MMRGVLAEALGELPGDEPWRGEVLRRAADLQTALRASDERRSLAAAVSLLGLGEGSTPAGDDYLVGVLHALGCGSPACGVDAAAAESLRAALAGGALTRTTAASAAWLAAAARGSASPVWSALLAALASRDDDRVAAAARIVRGTGHTSGAFSLRGFLDTLA